MRILAMAFNVILIGFTVMVSLTDGLPRGALYIVFGMLLILVPIVNVVIITRRRPSVLGIIANLVLLGFSVFALVDQYPHPRETGFIEYAILAVLTPGLSALVIALAKGSSPRAERPAATA